MALPVPPAERLYRAWSACASPDAQVMEGAMAVDRSEMRCVNCRRGRGSLYMIRVTAEGRAVSFVCRVCHQTWTAMYPLAPLFEPVPGHEPPSENGAAPRGDVSPGSHHQEKPRMTHPLETFYGLVDDIAIAMLTTRRPDGHLRSRPMATQKRADGADLWFVTADGSGKLNDIARDPHVNLAYFKSSSMEWISVSGTAAVSRDRPTIEALYAPDWKMWFPDEGDPAHGTARDPRMALIGVTIAAAEFLEVDKPKPIVLYELVKGWLTGSEPDIGRTQSL